MNLKILTTVLSVVILFGIPSVFAQGNLTPPGAPAPTMKTLQQVEPRTPISSAPFTITQSGSYYLTTNLTSTGHGVIIAASGVTLDLMGFTITGDRGATDYGVFLDGATSSAIRNIVVRNGIVRNFSDGVLAEYTLDSRFEFLIAASNSIFGILLNGTSGQCNGNMIANCTVSGNTASGIRLSGNSGRCDGNAIVDCMISGNGDSGVFLSGDNSGECDGNSITDCTISGNTDNGVYLSGISSGECNGNVIADCTINGNGNYGISLYGFGGKCQGNTIADCTIRKNALRGISLYQVHRNRVEGNHVTGQSGEGVTTYGIYCSGTGGNLIIRNTCLGPSNNFTMSDYDTYGPIISGHLGVLPGVGPSVHPLANFSH